MLHSQKQVSGISSTSPSHLKYIFKKEERKIQVFSQETHREPRRKRILLKQKGQTERFDLETLSSDLGYK
jgi:hypothetical protein